jgi:hypothetical protein
LSWAIIVNFAATAAKSLAATLLLLMMAKEMEDAECKNRQGAYREAGKTPPKRRRAPWLS